MRSKLTLLFVIVWFWTTLALILLVIANISSYVNKCDTLNALPQDSIYVTTRKSLSFDYPDSTLALINNNSKLRERSIWNCNKLERKKISGYIMSVKGLEKYFSKGLKFYYSSSEGYRMLPYIPYGAHASFAIEDKNNYFSQEYPCYGLAQKVGHNPVLGCNIDGLGWEISVNHITHTYWDQVNIYPYQIILKNNQTEFNSTIVKEILDSAYYYFTSNPNSPFLSKIRTALNDSLSYKDLTVSSSFTSRYNFYISYFPFRNKAEYESALWNHLRATSSIDFPSKRATMLLLDEEFHDQLDQQSLRPILGYWSNDDAIELMVCKARVANINLKYKNEVELNFLSKPFVVLFVIILLILLIEIFLVLRGLRKPIFHSIYNKINLGHAENILYISLTIVLVTFMITNILYTERLHERTITANHSREQRLPINNMDSVYQEQMGEIRYYFNSIWIEDKYLRFNINEHFKGEYRINESLYEGNGTYIKVRGDL